MNILSIGSDRKVFEPHSRVRERLVAYGDEVHSYAVVVTCGRSIRFTDAEMQPSRHVSLHPTYSFSPYLYPFDAIRTAASIVPARKHRKDWIVTAQDPFESGFSAWWISWRYHLPLQVQLHTDPFSHHFLSHSLLNRIRAGLARWVLPRATRVRVVSEYLRQKVHTAYRVPLERIDVLPVFVEEMALVDAPVHPIREKIPADAKVVLMMGRLAPEKDMTTAFETFGAVLESHPNTYLAIVGDGSLRPQLEEMASNERFAKKVLFLGWQQEVLSYYRDADVFLFTSQYEGYGMVLIEAALAGVAIVSTNVGIAGEFSGAQRAVRVCPVGDSKCLAREVIDLLAHDEMRRVQGMTAKEIARASYVSTLLEYAKKQAAIWSVMLANQ